MRRIFTTLVYLAVGAVIALALTGAAHACPPVAPAQAFGAGMVYAAPVAVAPAGYGMNLGVNLAPAPAAGYGVGVPLVPNVASVGSGGAYGGYGVSSAVGFVGAPPAAFVQNRVAVIHGRPGLFQRLRARRLLRRGF